MGMRAVLASPFCFWRGSMAGVAAPWLAAARAVMPEAEAAVPWGAPSRVVTGGCDAVSVCEGAAGAGAERAVSELSTRSMGELSFNGGGQCLAQGKRQRIEIEVLGKGGLPMDIGHLQVAESAGVDSMER